MSQSNQNNDTNDAHATELHRCELCDGETEELTLTTDSHPQGVNHLVCEECSG